MLMAWTVDLARVAMTLMWRSKLRLCEIKIPRYRTVIDRFTAYSPLVGSWSPMLEGMEPWLGRFRL